MNEAVEVKHEVKVFEVNAACGCGGTFIATGLVMTASPPIYEHRCSSCGKYNNFRKRYPATEFKRV
ncbi:hypothetical protein [Burkholderia phage BCSR5]|nr:hypothetical protein [Burkholderia phage BCSR5]